MALLAVRIMPSSGKPAELMAAAGIDSASIAEQPAGSFAKPSRRLGKRRSTPVGPAGTRVPFAAWQS